MKKDNAWLNTLDAIMKTGWVGLSGQISLLER